MNLSIQSGGNILPARRSLKNILFSQSYNLSIDKSVKNALKQFEFKVCNSGNGSGYGWGKSVSSNVILCSCVKRGHIHRNCSCKVNGYSVNPSNESTGVSKKPIVSYTNDLATAIMTRNIKKYKLFTSWNNCYGMWGFQSKDGHK